MEKLHSYRYFATICFMGNNYSGWQIQPGTQTVQQTLESALGTLLKTSISATGAGRTDSGVHARNYTLHFDSLFSLENEQIADLVYKLNRILPPDISVLNIYPVVPEAHARFSAVSRRYEYLILREKDPFYVGRSWLMERPLDLQMMRDCTEILFQYNDFQCFSRSNTQVKNYNCKIVEASWKEDGTLLIFNIKADRFLRNMVRAIVGTLVEAGLGKISTADMIKIIESRNRSNAGYSVPACGLYFTGAEYRMGEIVNGKRIIS